MKVALTALAGPSNASYMNLSWRRERPLSFFHLIFTFLFAFSLRLKALFFSFLSFFCLLLGLVTHVWESILSSGLGRGTYSSPFSFRRSTCAFFISSLRCFSLNFEKSSDSMDASSPECFSIFFTCYSKRRVNGEGASKAASIDSLFFWVWANSFSSYIALKFAMHSVALWSTLSNCETLLERSFIIISFSQRALWFFKRLSMWCSFSLIHSRRSLLSSLTWCSFFPHFTSIVSSSIRGSSLGVLGPWVSLYFIWGVERLLLSWFFIWFPSPLRNNFTLGKGFLLLETSTTFSSFSLASCFVLPQFLKPYFLAFSLQLLLSCSFFFTY